MFRRKSYTDDSDENLMLALQKGRQKALAELYRRYEERMRYYFFRMTGQDLELARDLCQDLFVRLSEKARHYQPGRPFKTWIYSLAHNMCKNHYRHQKVVELARGELVPEGESLPAASIIADIDAAEFRNRINAALLQLDAERRSAFLLRHREGMQLSEIAHVQQCPIGTVKSRLHYVNRYLAQQLADLKPEILS